MMRHAVSQWWLFAMTFLGQGAGTIAVTLLPHFYGQLIDNLHQGFSETAVSTLWEISILLVILNIGFRIADFSAWPLYGSAMQHIYNECFSYLLRHGHAFFLDSFAGSLVKRVNRIVRSFEILLDQVIFSIYPLVLQLFFTIILIAERSVFLALLTLGWFCFFLLYTILFTRYKHRYELEANEIDTTISGRLADVVGNHATVTLFAKHRYEKDHFQYLTKNWKQIKIKLWRAIGISDAFQGILTLVLEVVLLYFGLKAWQEGDMTAGDFAVLQGLLVYLFAKVWDLGRTMRMVGQSYSDAAEMMEILNTPHAVQDVPGAKELVVKKGKIDIRHLQFSYNEEEGVESHEDKSTATVFSDFSLSIPAGRKVALVSRSGEGKSTLTKLLLRYYNVPLGSIFIDNQDIMQVTQDSLRRAISFVPQEPILFHRTLRENITYGNPDASEEEMVAAAQKAHCHTFISNLPQGYDTYVGERGVKLSGGERQRVAIARAILENAPILILDEATSSLDSEAERYIQEALAELMKGKTTIVIAHRLSTIVQMDEIIVIENGEITERGTHAELSRKKKGHYKMLWEIQAGGFAPSDNQTLVGHDS